MTIRVWADTRIGVLVWLSMRTYDHPWMRVSDLRFIHTNTTQNDSTEDPPRSLHLGSR